MDNYKDTLFNEEDFGNLEQEEEVLPSSERNDSWNENGLSRSSLSSATGGRRKKTSPKVSVSLSSNLSAPVLPYTQLEEIFNSSTKPNDIVFKKNVIPLPEFEGLQDAKFKPIRLSNQEQKLIYALSYLLTIEEESPKLFSLINETEKGTDEALYFPIEINAGIVSKIMTGESRTRYKNNVGAILANLIHINGIWKSKFKKGSKDESPRTLYFTFPLVNSEGFIYEDITEPDGTRKKNFIGAKLTLMRPFFNDIRSKNTPLNPKIFKLWKDCNLFANLFSKINELWFFAWVGYNSAKKEVIEQYKNISATKIPEVEEEIHKKQYQALTRTLDFDTIMNLAEDDYNSTKQKRLRFRKDLEDCLKRFVTYGIITDKSHILPDKKQVIFVFNPNFNGKTEGSLIEGKDTNPNE